MSNKLDFSKELLGRRALVTGGTRGRILARKAVVTAP